MTTLTVYGLKTCDTCRKALKWLEARGITARFHDVRAQDIPPHTLEAWLAAHGPGLLVNTRSTTWRGLDAKEKAADLTPERALALIRAHPTLLKRPVFEKGPHTIIGFRDDAKRQLEAWLTR